MRTRFLLPVLALIMVLTTATASATEPSAERTSYGMEVTASGLVTADGKMICAVYDENNRMLGVELVSDPGDILVYCDVNQVRRVNVFSVAKDTMAPLATSAETTLEAPVTPIHVHIWGNGTVAQAPSCEEDGIMRYTCTSSDCNETPKATKSEAIPTTGHSWGKWAKTDDSIHTRICSSDPFHTETAPHNWDHGVITTQPSGTTEGVKTFTCSDCGGTKTESVPAAGCEDVWFTVASYGPYYYVNWTPVELDADESYFVNGNYCGPNPSYQIFSPYKPPFDLTDMDIIVERGTFANKTPLYTAKNAVQTETLGDMSFSLSGQTDGTYLLGTGGDTTGLSYYVKLMDETGQELVKTAYTDTSLNIYPWDGSTVEVMAGSFSISEDTHILSFCHTPPKQITTFQRPATPSAQTVTTADELKAALTVGGTITLDADIALGNAAISIYGGEPATLNLNGHTLTGGMLQLNHGKELTIDGTAANSGITSILQPQHGTKLTINGGTYERINATSVRTLSLTNATFNNTTSNLAIGANNCGDVTLTNCTVTSSENSAVNVRSSNSLTVTGGTFTCTSTSSSYDAIYSSYTKNVSVTGTTASAAGGRAANLGYADTITVTDGSFISTSSSASAVYVFGSEDVFVGGKQDGSKDPADVLIRGARVALESYGNKQITLTDVTADVPAGGSNSTSAVEVRGGSSAGYSADLTRITGIGGKYEALKASSIEHLTITDCSFTADYAQTNACGMNIGGRNSYPDTTLTITNTSATGVTGASIFNYADAELTNVKLTGSLQSLYSTGVYAMSVTNSQVTGNLNFANQSGTHETCLLDGVTMTGCLSVMGGSTASYFKTVTVKNCNFDLPEVSYAPLLSLGNSYAQLIVESGIFEANPAEFVDAATSVVTDNGDGTWTVSPITN